MQNKEIPKRTEKKMKKNVKNTNYLVLEPNSKFI